MNFKEKTEEYKIRHKEWRSLSLNQLSIVNNSFTSLALAFLAFVFKPDTLVNISFMPLKADFKLSLVSISLVLLITSIVFGLLILLTRIYDFRLSRHLALSRQRMMNHYKSRDGYLPNNNDRDYNLCDRLNALFKIVFLKIDFITRSEIENRDKADVVSDKFKRLQEFSSILGSATWKWLKIQIILFLFSIILYGWYIFK